MTLKFIKSAEKKRIIEELNQKFGIKKFPYLLIESGREKIRAYSGSLSKDEIVELGRLARVEGLGVYFLKKELGGMRLSFEAAQLLKNQITKNILEIDDKQLALWIRGNDLDMQVPAGLYLIKHDQDSFGCGKSNEKKVYNHVPKERRLKNTKTL